MKRLISFVLVGMLGLSMAACSSSGQENITGNGNTETSYESKLFDNSYVHKIDVQIAEEDWKDLCTNPLDKTKYEVNVVIDGEKIEQVSFATKGNTSLTSVASDSESDRYSFKINFGKFVDGQTYYGLDKLNLNNLYADATYMKDYLSYEIFRQAGVNAPLTSYVQISINGEVFGLYIAIEEIGESYLARTKTDAELYKPETEMLANIGEAGNGEMPQMPNGMGNGEMPQMPNGMGNGEMPQMPNGMGNGETPQMPNGMENGEMPQMPNDMGNGEMPNGMENGEMPQMPNGMGNGEMPQMPNGMGNGEISQVPGGMEVSQDNGASLKFTDDKEESYSDIFDNSETDADETDKQRVIAALKNLSQGNIEESVDVDKVLRYFVAHNFVLNYDSYTGNMLHNYYLVEEDGILSLLPWDYNLAFGAFSGEDRTGANATDLINGGIDSPLFGTTETERPMWSWITSNEEYLKEYHEIYEGLIENYFKSGEFEKEISRVYTMIKPYVEKDLSAFYTAEEFDVAYATLREFCLLRSESIGLQLEGTLSTITVEQDKEDMVDASSLNILDMGSQTRVGNDKGNLWESKF